MEDADEAVAQGGERLVVAVAVGAAGVAVGAGAGRADQSGECLLGEGVGESPVPLTPILDELRRRGHGISVRTLASQVPLMRTRGFAAASISAQVEAVDMQDWRARTPQKALAAAVRGFCARAEFDADDLRQAIRDEQPDAVLVDIKAWGALAAAEQWGGPWGACCPYPLALRSDQVPPFGPGLPPARGPLGRTRDRVLRPVVLGTIEKQMVPSLNGVRRG